MFTIKPYNWCIKNLIPFIFISLTACTAPKPYSVIKSQGDQILIGSVQKSLLQTHASSLWFEPNYQQYKPNSVIIDSLKWHANNLQVLVFAGSWCSDTQRELPRFFKVADAIGLNPNQIDIHMLNENKKGFYINESIFKIQSVPTFIFFKNGKEIGRIVESTTLPFEQEWLNLLSN
ncbi:MAG: thioredoxin family protein [Bacteroidota bacterium]|nr:thioredoxin family protein [Bacteroidota bacterium]